MELVGEDDEALLGFDTPLDAVHGDASFGHEVKDNYETMMRVGVEAATLEFLGCSPREKDKVARDADIGGRTTLKVVFGRTQLECVL